MTINLSRAAELINLMLSATKELTALTGRPFTPDGHLVGSIGEVLVARAYGLTLTPPSTKGCDAVIGDLRVEIKATFGNRVAFRRHDSAAFSHRCLVVKLRGGVQFDEVYNGPMSMLTAEIENRSLPSNGQLQLSLAKLTKLNLTVAIAERLVRHDANVLSREKL